MAVKFSAELAAIVEAITSYETFARGSASSPFATSPTGCSRSTTEPSVRR